MKSKDTKDIEAFLNNENNILENEPDLQKMVLHSPVGICILNAETLVAELVNDSFIEVAGKKYEEIAGRFYWDAFAEAREYYEPALDKVVKEGKNFYASEIELMLIRHGKEEIIYVTFVYSPLKSDDGKVKKVAIWVLENTQQVEARKKIKESEERLNLVIEASGLGTWELNIKTGEPLYSSRYLEIFGYKDKVFLTHKQQLQHLHPEDRPNRDKALDQAFKTGVLHYECRLIWNDKSVHWIEDKGKLFYDSENKPSRLIGAIRDITEQKRQEAELKESESKYRRLSDSLEKQILNRTKDLEQLNESLKLSEERYHLMVEEVEDYAILYLNRDGIVQNWNKGAEKIKGFTANEIIGKSFSDFYTEEDKKNNLPFQLLEKAEKTGRARQEGWRVRKNRTFFWASVVITAVHNDKGEVIGFSKVTHDLSEKKRADDELKAKAAELLKKNTELEKMNNELQSFAYISSHDLQEPLRKIQTFSSQIQQNEFVNLSENGKDSFKRMQNAAKRMQTLIEDLLSYSRTSTSERKFETVNLNKIIEEVKDDLKEELLSKNATIEATGMCEAHIIPFQFRQLLNNLFSNSLKFSKANNPPLLVIKSEIIEAKNPDNPSNNSDSFYCHITVSDNGIGFEQQYSEKIFEMFKRLHGRVEYDGTGIGLAIVKKIVENHNGFITAKGKLNEGATFEIYIPSK